MFLLDSSFFCWKEERFYKYITKPTLDDFSLNLYFYSYAAIVYVLIIVQIYYNQKPLYGNLYFQFRNNEMLRLSTTTKQKLFIHANYDIRLCLIT